MNYNKNRMTKDKRQNKMIQIRMIISISLFEYFAAGIFSKREMSSFRLLPFVKCSVGLVYTCIETPFYLRTRQSEWDVEKTQTFDIFMINIFFLQIYRNVMMEKKKILLSV